MDVDMDAAGAAASGRGGPLSSRPAGFLTLSDTGTAGPARPATPRSPFMPTPRKRPMRPKMAVTAATAPVMGDVCAAREPLRESHSANDTAWTPRAAAPWASTAPRGPRSLGARAATPAPETPRAPPVKARSPSPAREAGLVGADAVHSAPVRRTAPRTLAPPPRPASSMAAASPAPARRLPRPDTVLGSPIRVPQRPASAMRASDEARAETPSVAPRVRAPLDPLSTRRHRVRLADDAATPRDTRPRPPTVAATPVRRKQPDPPPRPPSPSMRIDVETLADEVGDGSFVLHQDDTPAADSVQVHVRLRPPQDGEECAWVADPASASIMLAPAIAATKVQPNVGARLQFDGVHLGSSNADIYAALARPLVHSVLHGYHAVIFAYGQTASGKTFTLSGDEDGREQGLITRAVHDLFQGICQGAGEREYLLRVSYLEIYNEVVKDLLEPTNQPQVRDDRRFGANAVRVAPLQEAVVTSPAQVFRLLAKGDAHRHVGATDWNERSSRSHTCLKITVESWDRLPGAPRPYRVSELSLIDLAGSERHSAQTAPRRTEGGNINKSLLSLGKVIYALSEKNVHARAAAPTHIPYRDSKLTRILQNSLSGHARIAVVCTLNPAPAMVEESLSTLHFARRIKFVTVQAELNEYEGDAAVLDESNALLARYRREMGSLRAQVAQLSTPAPRAAAEAPPSPPTLQTVQARLRELGALILQGGTSVSEADVAPHPVSPAKQRGFAFDDPLPRVQEKLHAALDKVHRLERKLAQRMSLTPVSPEAQVAAKDKLILELERRVRELEIVCEAQVQAAPAQLRDDVEAEWAERVAQATSQIEERDAFITEMNNEVRRLRRANDALVRLAHDQTAKMVEQLAPPAHAPVMSLFAPQWRPTPALSQAQALPAPDLSIDTDSDDKLSSSSLESLLESD